MTPDMRILVVQLWGIGDVVMTLPAIAALRHRHPSGKIDSVVGSATTATVMRMSGLANSVIIADKRRRARFLMTFLRLRRQGYDAAIVATRQTARLAPLLRYGAGIRHVIGDAPSRYQRGLLEGDPEHRVISNIRLVERLIGPVDVSAPTLAAPQCDAVLAAIPALSKPCHRLVGIHTGSEPAVPHKRYPTQQFVEAVTGLLALDPTVHVVAFFGGQPADDRDLFAALDARVHIVADQPLESVTALIARCDLFVSGDSGLGHLAAALGVPTITIAGPTQIHSTRPFSTANSVVRTDLALPCQPCYGGPLFGRCDHRSCLTSIQPSDVARRAADMLGRVGERPRTAAGR
jgi:ADP-heptose:LPS heptosyltransferase